MRTAWPAVVFGGLAIAFAILFGPALAADVAGRDAQMRPAAGAQVRKAACRTFFFMLTTCTVSIEDRAGPPIELRYALSGVARREKVEVLRAEGAQGYLTTSLGRDTLLNRSLTFIGWLATLLALTWGGVRYHAYHRAKALRQ